MLKRITIFTLLALVLAGCALFAPDESAQPDASVGRIPISDTFQSSYDIRLTSPRQNQVLKSPFLVAGEANIPGGAVYVRVKNPNNEVVISAEARVKTEQGEPGPFSVLLSFVFQATDRGTVEVYGIDPATDQEVALQSIAVNFDTSGSGSAQIQTQ